MPSQQAVRTLTGTLGSFKTGTQLFLDKGCAEVPVETTGYMN